MARTSRSPIATSIASGRSSDYNYYIDENLYAEELGFDIVALNEHHGNPFCMGSVMNVEAANPRAAHQEGSHSADRQSTAGA